MRSGAVDVESVTKDADADEEVVVGGAGSVSGGTESEEDLEKGASSTVFPPLTRNADTSAATVESDSTATRSAPQV